MAEACRFYAHNWKNSFKHICILLCH